MADTTTGEPTSRLQALPGELRNRIYRQLIASFAEDPAVTLVRSKTFQPDEFRVRTPSITGTCRTIRHEFLSIYYAETCLTSYPTCDKDNTKAMIATWMMDTKHYINKVKKMRVVVLPADEVCLDIAHTYDETADKRTVRCAPNIGPRAKKACACPVPTEHGPLLSSSPGGSSVVMVQAALLACCFDLFERYHLLYVGDDEPMTCASCGQRRHMALKRRR